VFYTYETCVYTVRPDRYIVCTVCVYLISTRKVFLCTHVYIYRECMGASVWSSSAREIRRSGAITYARLYGVHYFKRHTRWFIIAFGFKYHNIRPSYCCVTWKEWQKRRPPNTSGVGLTVCARYFVYCSTFGFQTFVKLSRLVRVNIISIYIDHNNIIQTFGMCSTPSKLTTVDGSAYHEAFYVEENSCVCVRTNKTNYTETKECITRKTHNFDVWTLINNE